MKIIGKFMGARHIKLHKEWLEGNMRNGYYGGEIFMSEVLTRGRI